MIKDILWVSVEAGTSLFEVMLYFIFFNGFLTKKDVSFLNKAIIFMVAYIIQFSVSTWFQDVQAVMLISSILVAVGISLLLYSGKLYVRIFSPLLMIVLMAVMELITFFLFVTITHVDISEAITNPLIKLIGIVVKNILSLMAIKAITYYRKSDSGNINRGYRFMLLIVPAISLVLAYVIFDLTLKLGREDASLAMVGLVGLMYVNAIIFAVFEGLMRQLGKEYRYKLMEKQLDLQLVHYNQLAESRAHIREIWHDFKNHVNCMQILYDNNDRESLGEYMRNLSHIEESTKIIDTGNPVIDALLNNKQAVAVMNGIKFETELMLPANLSISPADICVILGNSLDNAIEACGRIKNPVTRKYVHLSMNYRIGYLVSVLSNTFEEQLKRQGKLFKTSKPSPELHGLGMQSIERTINQYGGNMKVVVDEGIFRLEIIMSVSVAGDDNPGEKEQSDVV